MPARQIKLIGIRKGVRTIADHGFDKEGSPTTQRQAILRMLSKTVTYGGQEYAAFSLAEAPTVTLSPNDPLDRALRDNTGRWQLPSKDWLAVREVFMAEEQSAIDAAEDRVRDKAAAEVAHQLSGMVKRGVESAAAKEKANVKA